MICKHLSLCGSGHTIAGDSLNDPSRSKICAPCLDPDRKSVVKEKGIATLLLSGIHQFQSQNNKLKNHRATPSRPKEHRIVYLAFSSASHTVVNQNQNENKIYTPTHLRLPRRDQGHRRFPVLNLHQFVRWIMSNLREQWNVFCDPWRNVRVGMETGAILL
ncbi:hypothetical protein AVEN_264990-1 [Araneus ventricosus]|uniref:Uncharacterized protein n=1 Tax=Araneus ventricosus TaxID=182803 RepID=A0A4Y2EMP4_ARAVE|nr:hypothetical protein AVEN_264990-1 [Araneus ventricosus]